MSAEYGAAETLFLQCVAPLSARGRSDRDVDHVLQISVRTVHHHVEAILSKLGVAGRERIAAALDRSSQISTP
ncbi:MAG TPA: LuxR C-terminal-related transcriptional regulator [Candidatus Tumulicola sp.]|jgi:DNA-binding NarL/FixJ family response regulator